MKVALVKPPATYANWYRQPALGLAYLSASLEQKGHHCRIFDAYFHSWSTDELIRRVTEYQPDLVGLTAMTHEIIQAANIASQLKANLDVPVAIGGCHVTALPQETLTEFPVFDYGVVGEGEYTTGELLEYLQTQTPARDTARHTSTPGPAKPALAPHTTAVDQPPTPDHDTCDANLETTVALLDSPPPRHAAQRLPDIKGLIYRDDDRVCVNEPRPFLTAAQLDALPHPAYHHYYADDRRALAGKHAYYLMFTSRGCPYNCAFCMQVLGRKVRRRSPQSIITEMERAIEHYGAHTFNFADEIFLFDNPQTRELLQLFIERGFPQRIRWSALTRANFVTPELIALAKKAGCFSLEMGVESGDDDVLNTIGKGITVAQIKNAVAVIKAAGISLGTYYILGHPGETAATARKTVDLAVELNTDSIAVGLMVPYPGTRIFDMAQQGTHGYRLLSRNWADYDKYGSRVLELRHLPHEQLAKLQKKALLGLYLKNFRLPELFAYLWKRRHALYVLLKKKTVGK